MPGRRLRLVTRHECELCATLEEMLLPYEAAGAIELERLDVDQDTALHAQHAYRVPVLLEGGNELLWGRIEPAEVEETLGPPPRAS